MRILSMLVLLAGCPGPSGTTTTSGASSSGCMWKPIPAGTYLVRYHVSPNYTPKDRGEVIDQVRTQFRAITERTLEASNVKLVEAQGQPQSVAVNIVVMNDGNDNYNLTVVAGDVSNSWGRRLHWSDTYTAPSKMIEDYATDFARSLIDPPRPCPY